MTGDWGNDGHMSRRQFISYSGVGLLALSMGLYQCNPLAELKTIARIELPSSVDGLDDDSLEIIYLASLAPSGHNTQPWSVKVIDPHHWIIGLALERCLPAVDPQNREALISIGAFLENLIIAAGIKGYDVETKIIAKQQDDREILDIIFHKVNHSTIFDVEKIKLRRTIRNNLLSHPLSTEDVAFLVGEHRDCFWYYPHQSKEGNYLGESTLLANQSQAYRNEAQEELAKWIRWSNDDISRYKNGLTPETMEMQGIVRWYVKHFYSSQSVLEHSFREATVKKVQEQVAAGSGWLLITSKDSSISELIDTGRKLQRLWLEVRDRNIAIHPMNQMLEEEPFQHEMSSSLGITDKIQFVLRIGYISNYPPPVSVRMLLTDIISTYHYASSSSICANKGNGDNALGKMPCKAAIATP